MKFAHTPHGERIMAAATAPEEAICPDCGGALLLRRRRCMNGDVTYYWRHRRNRNIDCPARRRPAKANSRK
jgi:predicted RNA-binding Zn-ribbon protein involved in translation (DUF1610 family)